MDWKKVYKDLCKLNLLVLLISGFASHFFLSRAHTMGIILGGLLIMANFHVFQHIIRRAFSPEGVMQNVKKAVIAKFVFRLLGLGIIMYLLITPGWVDPIGLTIGLSTVVISIVSFGIKTALKTRTGEVI